MASFIEKNKDFVLKLKIKSDNDQSQVRRVSLHRIADEKGNILYDELIGLVLVFTLPEEDTTTRNNRTYSVSFTYYDDEEDLITLASNEELIDAIELFAEQKFMRITSCVKPKISYSTAPTYGATYVHDTTASPLVDHRKSTKDNKYPPAPPIRAVLESFAGILSNAVNNLQEGLATQSPTSLRPDKNHRSCPLTNEDSNLDSSKISHPSSLKKKPMKAKIVGRNKKVQQVKAVNGRKVYKVSNGHASCKNAAPSTNSASNNIALAGAKFKVRSLEKNSSGSSDKAKESEEIDVVEAFIHGRHTCDGCLTTPIIGKRYHSKNLTDYDLCQKCYYNYKGNVIKYESIELRRDVAFQNLWRSRHQTAANLMAMRCQSGRDNRERSVPRNREQNHGKSNIHRVGVASQDGPRFVAQGSSQTLSKADRDKSSSTHKISFHSNAGQLDKSGADTNPNTQDNTSNTNHSDNLLKEAIANPDTQDNASNSNAFDDLLTEAITNPDAQNNTSKSNEFDDLLKEAIRRSLDDVIPKEDSTTKINEAMEMENNRSNEAFALSKKKPLVENKASENNVSDAKDCIPRSVDIVEHKTANVERIVYSDTTSDNTSLSFELKDAETMQNAMDTCSVDSEKLLSESSEQDALLTDTNDRIGSPSSKQNGSDNFKDESFASDAIGNGDVANLMGKTLDMVAGVISEMLSESEDREKPNDNGDVLGIESKQGELIVNSSDDATKVDESEDDADWSVVQSIVSSGTTESEQIGKAAEMLGSALFNSDMKSSGEDNGSNLIGSDSSFSIPSSVPTDLGTVHSYVTGASQVTRWATELEKLRELGFDNETSCIEILERTASDSSTIVTNIDLVVDELLSLNA